MRRRRVLLGIVVVLVVVLAGAVALGLTRDDGDGRSDAGSAAGSGFVEPSSPSSAPADTNEAAPPGSCPDEVAHPFTPTSITVTRVARGVPVIMPPRDANDVPGIPPLTDAGKRVFAYDREQHVRPGDDRGNVLLNAHTWPDGSALGNRLLDGLHRDGRIVVHGKGRRELCYRVTRRIEVPATAQVPAYYSRTGTPQLAIIVCSGRRLGPGQWEKRTIWYASPSS